VIYNYFDDDDDVDDAAAETESHSPEEGRSE